LKAEEPNGSKQKQRLYQHSGDRYLTGGCLTISLGCASLVVQVLITVALAFLIMIVGT
jgi:hypothetical protein